MHQYRHALALTLGLGLVAAVAPAHAAVQPDYLKGIPAFETASGSSARAHRTIAYDAPRAAKKAWEAFVDRAGGSWKGLWDADTDVPLRVYGSGIPTPGAMSSPATAEGYARALLGEHVDLLAPGAQISDFVLSANHLGGGIRTVAFYQHYRGMRVVGGQVSFRFKNDRMFVIASEAMPLVNARTGALGVGSEGATQRALEWVVDDFGSAAKTTGAVEGPMVLPIVHRANDVTGASIRYATVLSVRVDSRSPIARWDVYVDAFSGVPLARRQLLHFADGTLLYDASVRRPGASRTDYPAHAARVTIDGADVTSDIAGAVTWDGGAAGSVTLRPTGPFVGITNEAGALLTEDISLADGATFVWSHADSELEDAQLTTFIHANIAKEYARQITDLEWLDGQMPAAVNIDQSCNAFSDGDSINMFRGSNQCNNTGRLADVVYHEFGHSLHGQSIIPGAGEFDGALSEGISDYYAATITGDSGMGRGFFLSDEPLREIDPPNTEARWPEDVAEIHTTGLIIGGALWDLRKALIETLGEEAGIDHTDRIFIAIIQRASDIPSSYVEALAYDDDDGNLDNGTPNGCTITEAFAAHGIAGEDVGQSVGIRKPARDGFDVTMEYRVPESDCPVASVETAIVEWKVRGGEAGGSIDMELADEQFTATIPRQNEGDVVQYRVIVDLDDDSDLRFPRNAADPFYEFFLGDTEVLYCTDFETDPADDGWTHGLTSGEMSEGADDWQWGPVVGRSGSGDPDAAYSGNFVYGNDLGEGNYNGTYQADKVNFALTPEVDTQGYESVRLQYRRWLNVEDATYDQATIYANDTAVWVNADSADGDLHHTDKEWRFHDVDLTEQVADGKVQVKFEIASDQGLEFGGWTLDDVCVVGFVPSMCGDGAITGIEECDDGEGNSDEDPDACRSDCTNPTCGDGVRDTTEECDDGNSEDGDGCSAVCIDESGNGGNGDGEGGGCCSASGPDPAGLPVLLGLFAFGWIAVMRRRRRA